jgi:glycosyltransferase involved in cell wall biosynthesis
MHQDSRVDLTVVVTAHAEGRLLRPTLRSIVAALEELPDERVELLIVRDSADESTRRESDLWREQPATAGLVRIVDVQFGESGASRNAGAEAARGEFVAFVDGDDIVSRNYFVSALAILREATGPTVVHPEYVVSFGARRNLWRIGSSRSPEVSYRDLVRHNLWPSSAVSPRALLLEHPYRSLSPASGYGPEDWIWNIDTCAAGVLHLAAPETMFFWRVRERGGVNNSHAASVLPSFDLDALRRQLPAQEQPAPPASPAPPTGLRGVLRAGYRRARPLARRATGWLSDGARQRIYQTAVRSARLVSGSRAGAGEAAPAARSQVIDRALSEASRLDPAVSWSAYHFDTLPVWVARDDGYAEVLEAAVDGLGEEGGAVVAVPWVGVGGADVVALNYARALASSPTHSGRTRILATSLPERTERHLVPAELPLVQLDPRFLGFPPELRHRLVAQLVVLSRPALVVSVNCSDLTSAMGPHALPITDGTAVYTTLFAFHHVRGGYPVSYLSDDPQRAYFDQLAGILTDNTKTAALIEDTFALPPSKVLVHRQPLESDRPTGTTWAADDDRVDFDATEPFRLIWPHRLDEEKCPEALVGIAAELRRRGLDATIDVWGRRVLDAGPGSLMADLAAAGVNYRGPYSGGLRGIDLSGYHALLLTSKSEGLPLVLVESLRLGLPVISSGIGGIPDLIIDGQTGLLTRGPDDASGFADAIERLMADAELRRSLIHRGREFAQQHHSWPAFQSAVSAAF